MLRIKIQKVLHNWGNIFLIMGTFLSVLARVVFKTQSKVYGGAFLQKQLMTSGCSLILQKKEYMFDYFAKIDLLPRKKKQIILHYFTYFYIILYDFINSPAFLDTKQTLHYKAATE